MSPRNNAATAAGTKTRIVERTVQLAASEGFDAASLGRVASDLSMSKAGVLGHFGKMETLHLAAVQAAIESFRAQVWDPASKVPRGLPRLTRICDRWIAYLGGPQYVGGCFNSGEYHRSPAVRDAVARALQGWNETLAAEVRVAQEAGDLPNDDPGDVAFGLAAAAAATGQALRLGLDLDARKRGRRLMDMLLPSSSADGAHMRGKR